VGPEDYDWKSPFSSNVFIQRAKRKKQKSGRRNGQIIAVAKRGERAYIYIGKGRHSGGKEKRSWQIVEHGKNTAFCW